MEALIQFCSDDESKSIFTAPEWLYHDNLQLYGELERLFGNRTPKVNTYCMYMMSKTNIFRAKTYLNGIELDVILLPRAYWYEKNLYGIQISYFAFLCSDAKGIMSIMDAYREPPSSYNNVFISIYDGDILHVLRRKYLETYKLIDKFVQTGKFTYNKPEPVVSTDEPDTVTDENGITWVTIETNNSND